MLAVSIWGFNCYKTFKQLEAIWNLKPLPEGRETSDSGAAHV